VIKRVLSGHAMPAHRLEILCAVPEPVGLRLDRGALIAFPQGTRMRRAVRDGTRVVITFRDASALQMLAHMTF